MKKYYILEVNDKSAGESPNNYNWKGKTSASALKDYIHEHKDFPSFMPNLTIEIYDDPNFNKVNDFIFGTIDKFCVSKKVKDILEQFSLPKHRFYPVDVFVPKKILGIIKSRKKLDDEYFAFNFDFFHISNNEHWIDYEKTEFEKNGIYIDKTEHIFLNENFDQNIDLFQLRYSWMTYVSEELMDELIKSKVTGLTFSEINEKQYKVKRPNPKITWEYL